MEKWQIGLLTTLAAMAALSGYQTLKALVRIEQRLQGLLERLVDLKHEVRGERRD